VLIATILFSAVLHATWNAIAKSIPDRLATSSLLGSTYFVVGAVGVALAPLPAAGAWPFIACSSMIQAGYLLLLMASYQVGDFGQVYPIARGLSPLLVSVVALLVLGQRPSVLEVVGIALVCGGIGTLVLVRGAPGLGRAQLLAIATGCVIATYSLLDGIGVRHSGGHPVAYAMWLFMLQGPLLVMIGLRSHGRRHLSTMSRYWRRGAVGGVLSLVSYGIVVWAQSRTALASVATVRETSVIFGAVIGWIVFHERLGPVRVLAAALVAGGVLAIAL
jgi:drug/metabolite transporter (DMT)-like permease